MYILISVLIILVCVVLALTVLVQNSKGGGLSSGFAASSQIMGVRKTSDFIEKLTWGLAITLVVLSLAANFMIPKGGATSGSESRIKEQIDNAPMPQAPAQQQPTQQPAQQPQQAPAQK